MQDDKEPEFTSKPTNVVEEAIAQYNKAHACTPNGAIDEEWDKLSQQIVGQETPKKP